MAATQSQVLQEFLVAIGFKIDEAGAKKFRSGLSETTKDATKLGGVVLGIGLAVEQFVQRMAEGMEKLYFASQRSGSSVESLRAFQSAAENVGVSADAAQQSIDALQIALLYKPGVKEYLEGLTNLGYGAVDTTKSAAEQMDQLLDIFERMRAAGPEVAGQIPAMANQLGVSMDTINRLITLNKERKVTEQERSAAMKEAGINQEDYAENAHKFQAALRGLGFEFGLLADQIENKLLGPLTSFVGSLTEMTMGIIRANAATTSGESVWKQMWRLITTGEAMGGAGEAAPAAAEGSADPLLEKALREQRARAAAVPTVPVGTKLPERYGTNPKATTTGFPAVSAAEQYQRDLDRLQILQQERGELETAGGDVGAINREIATTNASIMSNAQLGAAAMSAVTPGANQTAFTRLAGNRPAEVGEPQPITIEVNNEFNIQGSNADQIGSAVSKRQDRVNADMLRNLKSNAVPNAAPVPQSVPSAP